MRSLSLPTILVIEDSPEDYVADEFLANISHELRTPLNSIIGYNELLQDSFYGPLTEQQRNRLQIVHERSHHLLALINDILDLANIVAGKLYIDRDAVDVVYLCESSLSTITKATLEKHVALHRSFDPRVHTMNGDARRLKQVLVNLLLNAVKFTPAGGQIGLEVKAEPAQGIASFCVWDTGIGIAPTEMTLLTPSGCSRALPRGVAHQSLIDGGAYDIIAPLYCPGAAPASAAQPPLPHYHRRP